MAYLWMNDAKQPIALICLTCSAALFAQQDLETPLQKAKRVAAETIQEIEQAPRPSILDAR